MCLKYFLAKLIKNEFHLQNSLLTPYCYYSHYYHYKFGNVNMNILIIINSLQHKQYLIFFSEQILLNQINDLFCFRLMSNALMAKFNMKGAKDEKVGFTKKTVYTAIKGIYASFFFLYCIIPRLYPDMLLFRSGSEFWSEQILKIINSRAKFT